MNLLYTLLLAFPIGWLVASRSWAVLTYLTVGSWVFAFQSLNLLLSWLSHSGRSAFGPFPTGFPAVADTGEVAGYAVMNVVITLAGVGLVLLGVRLRQRRAVRREARTMTPSELG